MKVAWLTPGAHASALEIPIRAGTWITLGYLCAGSIGLMAAQAARFGTPLVIAIAAGLVASLVVKYETAPLPAPSQGSAPASTGVRALNRRDAKAAV